MNLKKYIAELKRRNVFKAAIAYLIMAWLIAQVASIVLPTFNAPPYVMKTLLFILSIGFPLNLVFSWIYDITPEGIKKTDSHDKNSILKSSRLNKVIIVSLSIAIVLLLFNQFYNSNNSITKANNDIESSDSNDKSIAVLAFTNMSSEKDQDYFSDGISAELTSLLSKIGELKVIDRRSSFSYKNKSATLKQIGNELNVSYILDGSVRKYENMVRIDVQLINVSDGSHLWLDTYDRNMDDIFKIQDDIAKAVIKQLKIVLATNTISTIAKRPTTNLEAYRLYLEGLYYLNLAGFDNVNKTISLLEEAILLDPNFAQAHAVLAKVLILNSVDYENNVAWEGRAYVAIQEALSLDPDLPEAYVARGMWYWTPNNNFDHEKAIKDFRKATELNPGLSSAHEYLMLVYLHVGLLDEAFDYGKKAELLNPTNMFIRHYTGQVYHFQGNYVEALNTYNNVSDQFIPFFRIALKAQILNYQGKIEESFQIIEKGLLEYPTEPQLNSTYAILLAKAGRNDEAKNRITIAIENKKTLRHDHHLYHNLASSSALMGEKQKAVSWLIKAAETGFPCYPLYNRDPNLESLKGYPAFEDFMSGMKKKLEYYSSL